jgi:uncharacterized protein YkwD
MANKRAFRPTDLEGRNQLEARVSLSHFGAAHVVFAKVQHGGHPHVNAPHGPKFRRRFALRNPAAHAGGGPTALSNPTTPVVVIPIASPPVSPPPVASPPASPPPVVTSPGTPPSSAVPSVPGVMSSQEQAIVDLVNQQRQLAGLAPLQVDSRLVQAAQIHSRDMAQLGQMEHTLPGAVLPGLVDRAGYVNYNYSYLGENIAFNYPDDDSVMTAWMNSSGHRANILNPNFTQIGVGIVTDGKGEPYYTQEFGRPA